ncbi:MFS transporter [Roseibium hamelinense]|uniref:MFS transporter n=1 Tax=Roseibium hamelinense TaxID=150831 RepID=UPI0014796742|nr:MFS transporter [Roseibium hamelinense]
MPSSFRPAAVAEQLALPSAIFFAVTVEMAPAGSVHHIAEGFGASVPEAAMGSAFYAVATALLALPMAFILRRSNLRRAFMAASFAFTLMALASAFAPDILIYTGFRVANGLVHAAFFPLALALAARSARAQPERAVAKALMGNALALALGIPAGEAMAELASWRLPMAVAAVGVVCSAAFAPAVPVGAFSTDKSEPRFSLSGGLVCVGTLFALIITGHFAFYAYFAPLVDVSSRPVALFLALYGASVVLATMVSGYLAARARLERACAIVCVEAAVLIASGLAGGELSFFLLAIGAGFCFGLLPTLVQTELLEIEGGNGTLASGIAVVAFNSGIAAGTFAGGMVEPLSMQYPPVLGGVFLLAAAFGLSVLVFSSVTHSSVFSRSSGE